MQRKKVDFPEPEGPIMQTTSPVSTSSETPLSTSRRPKRLRTTSALTIRVLIVFLRRLLALRPSRAGKRDIGEDAGAASQVGRGSRDGRSSGGRARGTWAAPW